VSKKKAKPRRDVRVNMRINKELLQWAKSYAAEKNISVTQLVVSYFTRLKEKTDG
jgi:predicted HicB family RNase H-like nuclease